MPINQLYDPWKMRIMELCPGQRITQVRAFVWLIVGIYLSRSVCMSRVACKMPGKAKLTSATRRLSRLLENPALRVREWYEPIARQWLEAQCRFMGEIHLIVDGLPSDVEQGIITSEYYCPWAVEVIALDE